MNPPHRPRPGMRRIDDPGFCRVGQKSPDRQGAAAGFDDLVGAEDRKRVFLAAFDQRAQFIQFHRCSHVALLSIFCPSDSAIPAPVDTAIAAASHQPEALAKEYAGGRLAARSFASASGWYESSGLKAELQLWPNSRFAIARENDKMSAGPLGNSHPARRWFHFRPIRLHPPAKRQEPVPCSHETAGPGAAGATIADGNSARGMAASLRAAFAVRSVRAAAVDCDSLGAVRHCTR